MPDLRNLEFPNVMEEGSSKLLVQNRTSRGRQNTLKKKE